MLPQDAFVGSEADHHYVCEGRIKPQLILPQCAITERLLHSDSF